MNKVLTVGSKLFVVTDFSKIVPIIVDDVIDYKEFFLICTKLENADDAKTVCVDMYSKFYQSKADFKLCVVAYASYDEAKKVAISLLDEKIAHAEKELGSLKKQKEQLI